MDGICSFETNLEDINYIPNKECIRAKLFTREEALKLQLLPRVALLLEVL